MGITIDEHIKVLESYGKGRKGFTGQPIDFQASINFAISTMRKYKQIEQIMKSKKMDALNIGLLIPKDMACVLHEIKEVMGDGNDKI